MAIIIPHRFQNRLIPNENYFKFIKTVIIGTFNPGIPKEEYLSNAESEIFSAIKTTKKFQAFDAVKNFYDRPQNRFWGVMDRLINPSYYKLNGMNATNKSGLKFYKGMNREDVFKRQQVFCREQGIVITDIVREIQPNSFVEIYDNFPDNKIEKANPTWNTNQILEFIEIYNPNKIVVNFNMNSRVIPNISSQILEIKNQHPNLTVSAMSTSGAAGYSYEDLIENWGKFVL